MLSFVSVTIAFIMVFVISVNPFVSTIAIFLDCLIILRFAVAFFTFFGEHCGIHDKCERQ
jgi:hypothetical protein